MMIRINLLPVRQVKKREQGQQMLVLYAVLIVFVGVLNFLWYNQRSGVFGRNQQHLNDIETRSKQLQKVIGEVDNINKRKKEVQDRLKALTELRKGRSGPVKMLDALSTATPKKVWLKEFDEKNNDVKLIGMAMSHDDVAEFMRGLSNVVWTPKGMGRLVEQRRDAKTSRVELFSSEGAIEDFPVGEISSFFTNIDLKKAEQKDAPAPGSSGVTSRTVEFEIRMKTSYAI